MNTQTDTTAIQTTIEDKIEDNATTATTGQQLHSAREAKNLTLEEVAKQLFLSKEIIVSLENDDYSKIVAPVYARGYLVKYARLLQIPMETILKDFKQTTTVMETTGENGEPIIKILQPIKIDTNQEQNASHWAIYTAIAILIMAFIVWGYNHYRSTDALKAVAATKEITTAKTNMAAVNVPATPNVAEQENPTEPAPATMTPSSSITTNDTQKTSQITSAIEMLPSTDESNGNRSGQTTTANN